MRVSHEYVNSLGVLIAILLGLSGMVERTPGIPMMGGGSGMSETPAKIHRTSDQISLETHHSGYIKVLNTNDQRAFVSISVFAADDCPAGVDPSQVNFFGRGVFGQGQLAGAYTSSPRGYDEWERVEILPEQIIDIPWEANVVRVPEANGALCANIRTLLSDGSSFGLLYRVDFFSNIFNEKAWEGQPMSAHDRISEAQVFDGGELSTLAEAEILELLSIGDDQFHGFMTHPGGTTFNLVPDRYCISFFGLQHCFLGEHVERDY